MAFDGDHVLLAWGGTLPGGEIFTNTLRMRDVNPIGFPDQVAIDGWLQGGFKDALATYWNAVKSLMGPNTKLVWMKANAVGTDGKYLESTTNLYTWGAPIAGTLANDSATQLAVAVSTTTAAARGRAHKGRWFLPIGPLNLDGVAGTFAAATSTTIANASAAFCTSLNGTASVLGVQQLRCAVMSNIGAGTHQDITGVKVGRVIDTQRRRRNKLVELGQTAAVDIDG